MVPLPLFKLGALFLRQFSKYGANRIKAQAHDHPRFRQFAAQYGQSIHQFNMRLSVAVLHGDAEAKARQKADLAAKPAHAADPDTAKSGSPVAKGSEHAAATLTTTAPTPTPPPAAEEAPAPRPSVWRRQFRPLPEAKAVELFADVLGDIFVLAIASALILYEYWRSSQKPDQNAERVRELRRRVDELEAADAAQRDRINHFEASLRALSAQATAAAAVTAVAHDQSPLRLAVGQSCR